MATTTWKLISQDKTDTTYNDSLSTFYDSTENIIISNNVILKNQLTDLTVDTTFGDIGSLLDVGQLWAKPYDINIFAKHTSNPVDNRIQKRLFELKNQQIYSEDVVNKFENYFEDNTSGSVIKIDLTSLINQYNLNPDFSNIIANANDCFTKYYFNIRAIYPISRTTVSNAEVVSMYNRGLIKPYFNNVATAIKSSIDFNRFLYDQFFTHKRKSFVLVDFIDGSHNVLVYFYDMRYDDGNIIISLNEYKATQGYNHTEVNSDGTTAYTNTDTQTQTMNQQYDYGSDDMFVFGNVPKKQTCVGGVIDDFTFSISDIMEFDSSNIQSFEIYDGKQHVDIDGSNFSSLYTAQITTVDNKQFNFPMVVNLDTEYDISLSNAIDNTKCTLFNQNELNSTWNGNAWDVSQDIFDISSVLALQTYDASLGVLTINLDEIKIVDNDMVFKIVSSLSKILKVENNFINQYLLINRDEYGIKDTQNWSRFSSFEDFPERLIDQNDLLTPFGMVSGKELKPNIQDSHKAGVPGDAFMGGSFGDAVRYEFYPSGTALVRAYKFMWNYLTDLETAGSSKTYSTGKTQTAGLYGFYNSLMNTIYSIETTSSDQDYLYPLMKQDLNTDVRTELIATGTIGSYLDYPKAAKYKIDGTSFELHTIKTSTTKAIYRNKYLFNKANFLEHYQYFYGWLWDFAYDKRIKIGYPTFINDNTVQIGDSLGNRFEMKYDLTSRTGNAYESLYHGKLSNEVIKYNRFLFPMSILNGNVQSFFRLDQTNAWAARMMAGQTAHTGAEKDMGLYNITPNEVTIYQHSFPTVDATFSPRFNMFIDESTQISSYRTTSDLFTRFDINHEDKTFDTTIGSGYRFVFPETSLGKIYLTSTSDNSHYTYDISTGEITFLCDPHLQIAHLYAWKYDIDDGHFYFLGTHSDDTSEIIFIQTDWDEELQSYEDINTWVVSGCPATTANAQLLKYDFNFIWKKDGIWYGFLPYQSYSFALDAPDDASTATFTYTNAINVDEQDDLEWQRLRGDSNSAYSGQIEDTPVIWFANAPFTFDSFESGTILHKKLWDEPWTDYIMQGSGITIDYSNDEQVNNSQNLGLALYEEDKHYIMHTPSTSVVPNEFLLYSKIDRTPYPPYLPKMCHRIFFMGTSDLSRIEPVQGWNIDNNVWFIAREGSSSVTINGITYGYLYRSQRKYDIIGDFEREYKINFTDSYNLSGSNYYIGGSWRNLSNQNQIDFISSNVYSWNSITDQFDEANVQGSGGTSWITLPTRKYVLGTYGMFSKERNRFFVHRDVNLYDPIGLYCGDNYIINWVSDSLVYSHARPCDQPLLCGANCDIPMLSRFEWRKLGADYGLMIRPIYPTDEKVYFDDQSNMILTDTTDLYIVPKPKFYNNIFTSDICPSTFDDQFNAIHTSIDGKWWSLGFGRQWFKELTDKIYVHKMPFGIESNDTTMLRDVKVNGEMSFNYRVLQYWKHNSCVTGYNWNDGNNGININITAAALCDFTALDFTKDSSTSLFVTGQIAFDYTIGEFSEFWDYGVNSDRKSLMRFIAADATDSTIIQTKTTYVSLCECLSSFNNTIDFENIVDVTVIEFNDFFITLNVTDSTGTSGSFSISNPMGTFAEFDNNKINWITRTAFYKSTDLTNDYIDAYVCIPHISKIAKYTFIYGKNIIDTTDAVDYTYANQYVSKAFNESYDINADLQYAVPLYIDQGTGVIWFANDVSNTLFSVALSTGNILDDYTDVKVRYKKSHGDTFKIWYDQISGDDYIRYNAVLGSDGSLDSITKQDPLSDYIIQNKNTDLTSFTVNSIGNTIDITAVDVTVTGIVLGEACEYVGLNWWFDSSDLIYVNLTVRNFKSHMNDEYVLILNKTDQKYDIEGKRFESVVYDLSQEVNLTHVIDTLFNKSNGIIRVKESPNYQLYSNLIGFYDSDSKSIKYLDYYDGLLYKVEDVVIYDGAFLYKNTNHKLSTKEFAIWYKMLPFMQYHDDLPDIYFFPYIYKDLTKVQGSKVNYMYDETTLYIFANFGETVDSVKVVMDMATVIDYNTELANWVVNNLEENIVEETISDFSGLFPLCNVLFDRSSGTPYELLSGNRLVKFTVDMTFVDWENKYPDVDFFSGDVGIDETGLNPFTACAIQSNTLYDTDNPVVLPDLTDNDSSISLSLAPTYSWNYGDSPTAQYFKMKDNTAHIEFYLAPLPAGGDHNAFEFSITPLTVNVDRGVSTGHAYFSYYKIYDARVEGTVKVAYNPDIYTIDNTYTRTKDYSNWDSYGYDFIDATLNPQDYVTYKQTSNANSMYDILNGLKDKAKFYRPETHIVQSILNTLDTTSGVSRPFDLTANIIDYTGTVDQSVWFSENGLVIEDGTTSHWGIFTFDEDVTFSYIYFEADDVFGNGSVTTIKMTEFYDENGVRIYPYDDSGNQTIAYIEEGYTGSTLGLAGYTAPVATVIGGVCTAIARTFKLEIYRSQQTGGFYDYDASNRNNKCKFGNFILSKTNVPYDATYSNFLSLYYSGGGYASVRLNKLLDMRRNSSILSYNTLQDDTFTMFARPESISNDCTLNIMSLDATCEILEEHHNSNQKHTFQLADGALGFTIKVTPETQNSVPMILVHSDSTEDDFSGTNGKYVSGYIKGKKTV